MDGQEVPEGVREFLREHVEGFEHLETLLLAARQPDRLWTADRVAQELHIDLRAAEDALAHLAAHALLVQDTTVRSYRYSPSTEPFRDAVKELVRVQEENRLAVMELLSANALERLRTMTLRTFAEAFRLRGPKKDG